MSQSESRGSGQRLMRARRVTPHSLGGMHMNKMVRMATMAVAMLVAASTVTKAQGGGGGGGGGRGAGRGGFNMAILDSIKATDAQKAKVDSIVKFYQAQNAPLMEAMRGGDADARTKLTAARAKQLEDIKALFNDDQKKQIDALVPQGRRGGGR